MATMLTDYTSYADIRAVLGVSTTELPDTALSLSRYETQVILALEDVHTDIPTQFATLSALPSPTTVQKRFVDLVKLYAPYALAKDLLVSLPLFSVKRLTDGRAEYERQVDPFADIRDGVTASLVALKYRLSAAYKALDSSYVTTDRPSFATILSSRLTVDPVTG